MQIKNRCTLEGRKICINPLTYSLKYIREGKIFNNKTISESFLLLF